MVITSHVQVVGTFFICLIPGKHLEFHCKNLKLLICSLSGFLFIQTVPHIADMTDGKSWKRTVGEGFCFIYFLFLKFEVCFH